MKVAVIIPSRGSIYADTIREILENLEHADADYTIIWSIGRPIPDCFEIPTLEALEGDYDYVLYIEDDMIVPKGIIQEMLDTKKDIVTCDTPMGTSDSGGILYDPDGNPFFTGCCILLVKTSILARMPKPIWRTDLRWNPKIENGYVHLRLTIDATTEFGHQDTAFGLRLYMNKIPIHVIETTAGQRRTIKAGTRESNIGYDTIIEKTKIVPRKMSSFAKETSKLESIVIDGKVVGVHKDMLAKSEDLQALRPVTAGHAIFSFPDSLKEWLYLRDCD